MEDTIQLKMIAHIRTDFPEKFGLPRQSGLVEELCGRIVFEPEYRNIDALRGIEDYDYLWLLWKFEGVERKNWSPTVRPPRLGGETHMGVFATRSPFRPNPIGLSCVKLLTIEKTVNGPELLVSGIDLRDKTPIYDIKPYLAYVDSHPKARGGFAAAVAEYELNVVFPQHLLEQLPPEKRNAAIEVLKQDPRPAYHEDATRIYGMAFAGFDIRFQVAKGVLTVCEIQKRQDEGN